MNPRIPYHWGKDIHDAWRDRGRTFSAYYDPAATKADRERRLANNQTVY